MARGRGAGLSSQPPRQTQADRRKIRDAYRKLNEKATAEKEELLRPESNKLQEALDEADALHQLVCKPREQKADADLLAKLTEFTLQAAKQLRPDASLCTPQAFVGRLLTHFVGGIDLDEDEEIDPDRFDWGNAGRIIGLPLIATAPGATCMLGPLDSQPKVRKQPQQRQKRKQPEKQTNPDEIVEQTNEGKEKETDVNMATMFNVMVRNPGGIPMDHLVLNKRSFSQTIENIFSLSFLAKDGRAALRKLDNGTILVEPKDPPTKEEQVLQQAEPSAFIPAFGHKDWLRLKEIGCIDYMPQRVGGDMPPRPPRNSTPVRKGHGKHRPRENSYSQQLVEEEEEEVEEEETRHTKKTSKRRRL